MQANNINIHNNVSVGAFSNNIPNVYFSSYQKKASLDI